MNSMESLVVDQSFSLGKQMKKTRQNVNNNNPHYYLHQTGGLSSRTTIARQPSTLSQKYATITPPQLMHEHDKKMMMMMMMMHGGLYLNYQQHASLPYNHHHHHHHHHHHLTNSFPPIMSQVGRQTPLLPFPRPLARSQSLSPPVLVPRKAPAKNSKGIHNNNGVNNPVQLSSGKMARKRTQLSIGPTKEIGPNPDVTRMMSHVEMDGPVFRMAPPPSSLPLPSFTLRKLPPPPPQPMKLMRCNAEAAAVDCAATDNICILLRLR